MNSKSNHSQPDGAATDGWDGILDESEEILWQGAPAPGLQLDYQSPLEFLSSAVFAGLAFYWIILAYQGTGHFGFVGVIFLAIGLYGLVFKHFWHAFVRQNTYYTLTDRRAFIATSVPMLEKKLNSYDITPETNLEITEGKYSKIIFAESVRRGRKQDYTIKIGFERLENGRDVYSKMRELQAKVEP